LRTAAVKPAPVNSLKRFSASAISGIEFVASIASCVHHDLCGHGALLFLHRERIKAPSVPVRRAREDEEGQAGVFTFPVKNRALKGKWAAACWPWKWDRKGRYHVQIEKYGRQGNLMKWREMLNADCPKRDGRLNDRCDLGCPDPAEGLIL
jgi:hypothetical protein